MTVLRDIDKIIIHVPKTGGSSVRWPAIKKFGNRYACQHCNIKMLPGIYKDFKKITFIRNPIDWYASRYFFDNKKYKNGAIKKEPFSDALSEDYSLDFETTLKRMLNLTETFKDERIFSLFKSKVLREVNNNYQTWWVSYFDDIDGLKPEDFGGKSLYQWFIDICGVYECDSIYRLEDQYSFGMKREFGEDIKLIHKNRTGRKPSREIYSKDSEILVKNVDSEIFKEFGYKL